MTFLRTAQQQGADAIAMQVDLARAPDPSVVAGLSCAPAEPPTAITRLRLTIHSTHFGAPRYPSTAKAGCSSRRADLTIGDAMLQPRRNEHGLSARRRRGGA